MYASFKANRYKMQRQPAQLCCSIIALFIPQAPLARYLSGLETRRCWKTNLQEEPTAVLEGAEIPAAPKAAPKLCEPTPTHGSFWGLELLPLPQHRLILNNQMLHACWNCPLREVLPGRDGSGWLIVCLCFPPSYLPCYLRCKTAIHFLQPPCMYFVSIQAAVSTHLAGMSAGCHSLLPNLSFYDRHQHFSVCADAALKFHSFSI